jgi:hypothetical protein
VTHAARTLRKEDGRRGDEKGMRGLHEHIEEKMKEIKVRTW